MDLTHLQDTSQAYKGVWAKAQARFYIQRAQSYCQQQLWSPALNMLMQLAKLGTEQNLNTSTWRAIVRGGMDVAARAGKRKAMAELIEGYSWLAWSGQSEQTQPWALEQTFAIAEQHGHWDAGAALGDMLGRQYPGFPFAPYASAHFREMTKVAEGNFDANIMGANAKRFELAHQLANTHNHNALANHCALRQGVALMLGGRDKQKGRALLKKMEVKSLTNQEKLWYMIGMSRSDFWLDRVRAADVLDSYATAVKHSRPDAGALTMTQVQRCVEYLFSREGLDLQSAEEDRLQSLIELVYQGNKQAQMRHVLTVRSKLQSQRDLPLEQSQHITELLEDRAHGAMDLWRKSASSFKFLTRFALTEMPDDQVEAIPRQAPDDFLLGAHAALELLHARQSQSLGNLTQTLRETLSALQTHKTLNIYPERLAPLASAWPNILEWLNSLEPDGDEHKSHAMELLQDTVVAWAQHAPRPGYGWWLLAGHLNKAGLRVAARAVAQRALSTSRPTPDEQSVRDDVMSQILAEVIEEGDQVSMLKWLDHAEGLYAPT